MRRKTVTEGEEKTELQMTSMIDVVFLLLIFFIATMKPIDLEHLLRAYLPKKQIGEVKPQDKPEEKKDEEDLQDITITLEKGGPVGAIIKKRTGYEVPIGQRAYDHKPIGSDIEEAKATAESN